MRIWDVSPAFLSRTRLLGEHRELHAIFTILHENKKGYRNHPETLRWENHLPALTLRHQDLVAEMTVRNFKHASLLPDISGSSVWPSVFLLSPGEQYLRLNEKYAGQESGRVSLPKSTTQLWANHKYSVLARDPKLYRTLGKMVAGLKRKAGFEELALRCVAILRQAPPRNRLRNALEHMWGHIAAPGSGPPPKSNVNLLESIVGAALTVREPYLLNSTALSDLWRWCKFYEH